MTTEREIQEATARCVAIAVFYHNSAKDDSTRDAYVADVRAVALWAAETALGEREIEERLLKPLCAKLIARYGDEVGLRLWSELVAAFHQALVPATRREPRTAARRSRAVPHGREAR